MAKKKTKKRLGANTLVLPGSTKAEDVYTNAWANRVSSAIAAQRNPRRRKNPYEL
jgi:hypothetical protein